MTNVPRFFWILACRLAGVAAGLTVATLSSAAKDEPISSDRILQRFAAEFVQLTPGKGVFPASFRMGSDKGPADEQPAHKVTLAYDFAMAKYELTQELFESIMGRNPSRWRGPRNSVEMVSWDEANDFCRRATMAMRKRKLIRDDESIRLPSEAEWEYACRAGTTTAYSFGDAAGDLGTYAWFTGNAKGNDPPVGAKKPNAWGLFDIHGYVWEWCADAWQPGYKDAPVDGSARVAPDAQDRVLRGGAWTETADRCRSAFRFHRPATERTAAIGFRCVRAGAK
jgi:formylglycine-generating enzyme required for sulfatase activity